MHTYAIDFETFYDKQYSLTCMGTDQYVCDDRFDAYLVSVVGPELRYCGRPSDFDWASIKDQHWVSHNARFDETVHSRLVELNLISSVFPVTWDCTADLAAWLHMPRSLKGAAKQLLDREISKEVRDQLKGKTETDLRQTDTYDETLAYALVDSELCLEIWNKFHHQWPENERLLSRLNRERGRHGIQIDTELLTESLDKLHRTKWEAEKDIPWDWSDNKTPLSPLKLREQCRVSGIPCPASVAQDSIECTTWENTYGVEHPWVNAMRLWRRSNMLLKRLETIQHRVRPDGTLPFSLLYFGAHTGRYSGSDGYNMQNMPRSDLFGVNLRRHFVARFQHKFVIPDLAQIEARVLLWLANDKKMLQQIEQGHSVYEAHAIQTMGWPRDNGKLKDCDPRLYLLAKSRILALGYGCGHKKFVVMAKKLADLDLSTEESQETVTDFRTKNPHITGVWDMFQRDCLMSRGDNYSIVLPSGRKLTYFKVQSYPFLSGELIAGSRRESLYGGKLTENVVQAIARDVFTEGILQLERDGCPVLFHVHDEMILERPEDQLAVDHIQEVLSRTPDWLKGCPISCEIKTSDYYLK